LPLLVVLASTSDHPFPVKSANPAGGSGATSTWSLSMLIVTPPYVSS
jgi:hypothetical protein